MSDWSPQMIQSLFDDALGVRPGEDVARKRTRLRILDTATKHFLRFGYRKASIADIASDAGVAKGTVYLYYKNKHALMIAAISYEKVAQIEPFNAVMALPPEQQLRGYMELIGRAVESSPLVARLTRGDREMQAVLEESGNMAAKLDERRDAFLGHLIRGTNPSLTEDELHKRVVVLNAIIMMTAQLNEPDLLQDQSVNDFSKTLADMLVSGLAERNST